jgi:ornithine cyclodeaminase/alanine dehydrogenase-like protein (mu-crystallin family)
LGSYLDHEFVRPTGLCVVNPFGMGITDVALGAAVYERAAALGLGLVLST